MDPLFKALVVALVPQPRQLPPPPFDAEDLQRVFMDVSRAYPYQGFGYLPGGLGAQLQNGPEDTVMLQPGLFQVNARMDGEAVLTVEGATDKAMTILRIASDRLGATAFLQCAVKVVAHVSAPGPQPDAKSFVTERLMRGEDHAKELGAEFFGAGVKFRRIHEAQEETLLIEPFVQDNTMVFVDFEATRAGIPQALRNLDDVATWIADAFSFVSGPTMTLLDHH